MTWQREGALPYPFPLALIGFVRFQWYKIHKVQNEAQKVSFVFAEIKFRSHHQSLTTIISKKIQRIKKIAIAKYNFIESYNFFLQFKSWYFGL
jgi:hypothetical protein